MKRVVLLDDLKESDIRPENVYNKYKEFLAKDIQKYFSDPSVMIKVDCPGCSDSKPEFMFNRIGFDYYACNKCGTFFVSPRPTEAELRSFYKNSSAGIFLREVFLGKTLKSRSKKVFSYRIQWIIGLVEEYLPGAKVFLDYSTRYPTFLRELANTGLFESIISVSPECYGQEDSFPKDLEIIDNGDMIENSVDMLSTFELVEKAFDPGKLFSSAYNACKTGGLYIITTTTSSGFEYQVLRQYCPNIIAPDRLNILSLEALTDRIKQAGFEIIEVSTPGRLDVEMVKRTYERNPDIPLDPFWKYVFQSRSEDALHSFQEYLQQFQLSSHIRIAARKV